MFNASSPAIGEAMPNAQHTATPPPVEYDNTLPGLVALYLAIDAIAQRAYTPDEIMDAIGDVRSLLRAEITNRTANDYLDIAAKLRLAAHLITDPAVMWDEDVTLLTDAVAWMSGLRAAWRREFAK